MNTAVFEEELNSTGRLVYTNKGVSMMPLIRPGKDVWVIEKRSPEEIKINDVVLFRGPVVQGEEGEHGFYVLHRVLKRYPDGRFWIVGDNCVTGDDVDPSDVLGVMTSLNRGGKMVDFHSFTYRAYVRLWCVPWRFRFRVLTCLRRFRGYVHAVKRRLGKRL